MGRGLVLKEGQLCPVVCSWIFHGHFGAPSGWTGGLLRKAVGCSGVHLGLCSPVSGLEAVWSPWRPWWGWCEEPVQEAVATQSFSGKVAREGAPLVPSLLSVLPNLLSWSGGKLQASLREGCCLSRHHLRYLRASRGTASLRHQDALTRLQSKGVVWTFLMEKVYLPFVRPRKCV